MDIEALTRMETFAKECLKLFPEQREAFFVEMVNDGLLTAEEAAGLSEYICYFRMFTDQRYYKAMKQTVGEMVCATFKTQGNGNE